jgi:hypothetical protein
MIMPKIVLKAMDSSHFDEAKTMMEQSFASTMQDCSDDNDTNGGNEDLPSLEGILEQPEATPLVFYMGETMVGGAVLILNEDNHNILELLFIRSDRLDKGIGYSAWLEIEKKYPQTKTWTTVTPPCLMRNVNFYVNKCGFHIIRVDDPKGEEAMFVFQKGM